MKGRNDITRLDSSGEAKLNSNTLTFTVKVPETTNKYNFICYIPDSPIDHVAMMLLFFYLVKMMCRS